jgi:hypothetical protein
MKTLRHYTESLTEEALNKAGAFYAFSAEQLSEQRVPGVAYVRTPSGLFCPKENFETLFGELENIYTNGIQKDIQENGLEAICKRELSNYECYYTGEIEDAVIALEPYGLSYDQVYSVFKGRGLEVA